MKKVILGVKLLVILYLILLIPIPEKEENLIEPTQNPFIWNQDEVWENLELSFLKAKSLPDKKLDSIVNSNLMELNFLVEELEQKTTSPTDSIYSYILNKYFEVAPFICAQEEKSDSYITIYNKVRRKIKLDSYHWDMNSSIARNTSYRILYGMRAASEEILLQSNSNDFVSTMFVKDEYSNAPTAEILGINIHSGDLLISRGGAEVSAFISRGNDYPGNFSHVAIVHIDKETKIPYFIEAHIEKGVAIATLNEYLKDEKLRFMVMRPRTDLPNLKSNPMLPSDAAYFIYNESQKRHIPYDFKMDYYDASAMFCSEVGSYAYKQFGINLWEFKSTISSKGTINWLQTFGVQNFVTQMPSDLEYDPLLSVVAEWRNKDVLFKDHLDNAVMDALITKANKGETLNFNVWQLPIARVIKFYSLVLNLIGKDGIIPNGMSATMALKNNDFVQKFKNCKALTEKKVEDFKETNGYLPPYWELVKFAETSIN